MRKYIKQISIILVLVVLCNFIVPNVQVYAMVNTEYFDLVSTSNITDQNDDKSGDSEPGTLLGIIMIAVLQIGKLIETTVSFLMGLFGNQIFPWADYIIFNCIPILDVNFINPAPTALFGSTFSNGDIGKIFRNIYFTGLSVAVGFLGIVVAIMAIKMAISTIASEKARYKESIVTLLTTLVLLFGTHYLLSFTFYMNEKMVEIASQITKNIQLNNSGREVSDINDTNNVVSSMGEYFYNKALADGGSDSFLIVTIEKAAPIPTVLYLVLIIQSLMFLFAYFKRLYYVAILSVIAPFVVIYDFLKKSLSM